MEKIHINRTKVSPEIILDPETGFAEVAGESYPENSVSFYAPVMEWLDQVIEAKKEVEFNFQLDYFNTSSSKCILDILTKLEKYHLDGGKLTVKWHYNEDDDDMQEAGEDFSADLTLPFELVSN
jgi:hypothetical protein